jgi:hypothetical protein
VGICILAAPGGRMVSVACATPAAYALMAALGAWQSHRVYPVPFEWGRLLVLGVFGALLFGADQWLAWRGLPPGSIAGIASKTGLFVALPALLLATGFFRHGEMRALRALVSRRTGSA